MQKVKLGLHLFYQDLRLHDNTALISGLRRCEKLLPVFIFDKESIITRDYPGDNSLFFLFQSLLDLNNQLQKHSSRLYFFAGKTEEILSRLFRFLPIDLLCENRGHSPWLLEKQKKTAELCRKSSIQYECFADYLLNEAEFVLKKDGNPYIKFTPYYRKAKERVVSPPVLNRFDNYFREKIDGAIDIEGFPGFKRLAVSSNGIRGGRKAGLSLLNSASALSDYGKKRDFPFLDYTSRLSGHNKTGTISIREFYHQIKKSLKPDNPLFSQLYWRDFFYQIAFYFPRVFSSAFYKKYDDLVWDNNPSFFKVWCKGKTGFPLVDAGMRQLRVSGYMHNRLRMITASFLVKDLHIDWRWGERYFAEKLVDFDAALNNGNWQWAASTGCDAQPYFRIFNPWLQQQKFDRECLFVKKWIPELQDLESADIHDWKKRLSAWNGYPSAIVDHRKERIVSERMFQGSRKDK